MQIINFFEERKTTVLKVWFLQWEEFVSGKMQRGSEL